LKEGSWKGDPAAVEGAELIVIVDDVAAQKAWKERAIDFYQASRDFLYRVPADLASDRGQLVRIPTSRVVYIGMSASGALRNRELRRAVQLGVNPAEVGRVAYGYAETRPATGLVPLGWADWNREARYRYRPDEAARLARGAGSGALRMP